MFVRTVSNAEGGFITFNKPLKTGIIVSTIVLFIVSSVTPMVIGYNVRISDITEQQNPTKSNGLMDSPWPMYCHDVRHTGRSPYSTADNPYTEKWKFWTELDGISSGIVVSDDGTIYFSGSYDFYAVHPNGTQKWRYGIIAPVLSCPAIDEDGTIYVGTAYVNTNLYAINPNGTLKWKFPAQIFSSPAIGDDGTIYFGDANNNINALYPNGTLRWRYKTNHVVYSSPAIGVDGTVYCGSHDCNMYALYPNNGTLKWKYPTGHWIRTSPCIADNGAIYFVSLDNYLYAVWPNETLRWKTNVGAGTSPTIGHDGTIYAGYTKLHAVNPNNGSVKWTFDVEGKIRGATPCNSIDGTIYLGNSEGSDIVAVNPDGTEKWRKYIGGDVESPPAIGEDGTVYIGSRLLNGGYLHAFGPQETNEPPGTPTITGPLKGKVGVEQWYKFKSIDPDNNPVSHYIEWGDGTQYGWTDDYASGEQVKVGHTWSEQDEYTIRCKSKDTLGEESDWGELKVTMPRNRAYINRPFLNFLQQQLNLFPIMRHLFRL
jgi:outer membrane protein assembly factor BamB